MKRILCLLTALLMAVSFAAAEEETAEQVPENREADLFDLWDCGTENAVWLTAAPEISEGVLMTVWALLPQDKEHLTVSDGKPRSLSLPAILAGRPWL